MAKVKTRFVCNACGYETNRWVGRCPECGGFSTMVEEVESAQSTNVRHPNGISGSVPRALAEIEPVSEPRVTTGIGELDRVLGGGFVQGSLTLLGGDPGIGKSTLILQICQSLGNQNKNILYVSGEESCQQIKLRADRLGITTARLKLLSETDLGAIERFILKEKPDYVVIDSIQTMFIDEITSAPGSISQVREATSRLMHLGKGNGISVIIVGHVTKDGAIAGPRILEHMVDTVLYFEGDKRAAYRMLRAVKNRYGANELGVFEMTDKGLREILNPSEFMLSGRPEGVSGSVVTCSMEGTRPLLLEVQALAGYTSFNIPRRTSTGVDFNRITLLLAVLEKRAIPKLAGYDCYVNLTGGIRVSEPSIDAAIIAAVASSFFDKPIDAGTVVIGEIGLTGELRAVPMIQQRVNEAAKLGFKYCVVPSANLKEIKNIKNIRLCGASTLDELLEILL